MSASLVGSEMCIRDSRNARRRRASARIRAYIGVDALPALQRARQVLESVSYTHLTLPTICSV
eukprot:1095058-Alexandrium_andersonii.AAC.1